MNPKFEKKTLELIQSDRITNFLDFQQMVQFQTRAGVSNLVSTVVFSEARDDDELEQIPDYILSDTLEKDLNGAIERCALGLKDTKYLPSITEIGSQFGALPLGELDGVYLKQWEDFAIINCNGELLYTEEILDEENATSQSRLAMALWLIVKDICDDGRILSEDWYKARMLYEYFYRRPVEPDSCFLIGGLFKELCMKQAFESDLSAYYQGLINEQSRRQRGSETTKSKAEELRSFCVNLFVEMADDLGPRLMLAPAEIQATELMKSALNKRPQDFMRSGKPYSKEWFLRNIIEDQKVQIIAALETLRPTKKT